VRAKNLNLEPTTTAAPQPVPLSLPSPAALGIAPAAQLPSASPDLVDWNAARARLNQLGAVSFNVNRLASGSYRMVVTLPTANPSQNYLVEVVAESEAVAVTTALERAETWAHK
jgi:hypothetical protein